MTARSGTALADSRMRASLAASRYLTAPESSEQLAQHGSTAGSLVQPCSDLKKKKKKVNTDESPSSSLKPGSLNMIASLRLHLGSSRSEGGG